MTPLATHLARLATVVTVALGSETIAVSAKKPRDAFSIDAVPEEATDAGYTPQVTGNFK